MFFRHAVDGEHHNARTGIRSRSWLKTAAVLLAACTCINGASGSQIAHRRAVQLDKRTPAANRFPTATNSLFMVPIYPTETSAAYSKPQFNDPAASGWPTDSFKPASPKPTSVRPDRPRLIAPAYKWNALPALIAKDPYLKYWDTTILGNATQYYGLPPVRYFMDGSSGILDNAREFKQRIKAFAYAYRTTKDSKWVDRAWQELENVAGKGSQPFGQDPDRWNSGHFLDTAEFSAGYAIAYDWLYDQWTSSQKTELRNTVIKYGLKYGLEAFGSDSRNIGWWKSNIKGNWNCVCNSGLTMAALAILGDDTTGDASQILGLTIDNAKQNCAMAPSSDGTWSETADYWYFGTTAHAEMASSLMTATGSDYGLLTVNPNFAKTGDYHMYAYGATSMFQWGDSGPNKFSTTANAMLLYGSSYNRPDYTLFQRDRPDAAEPWSMFWYDPTVSGAFWNGMAIDKVFGGWVSMRSSWTDFNALYVAMKGGKNQGRQTHNDLDVGDFVLDAMGTRWAGELGSADYNSPGYFSSDAQNSVRWKYYRKMTEGQNTILINQANQLVTADPKYLLSGSSGTKQGSSPVLQVSKDDTAFWVTDITSAYASASSVKRGVRLLNGRKQVLIQDEITSSASIQWRMHTNATITIDSPTTATLKRDGKTMSVSIISPASGATFAKSDAKRFASDPTPPVPDQNNSPVQVLIVNMKAGTYNLQVLFNPQWADGTQFITPKNVKLANWSLTSHN